MSEAAFPFPADSEPASYSVSEAQANFDALVRWAAHARERITITEHGKATAILLSQEEFEDLGDELALAQYRAEKAKGELVTTPHEDVVREIRRQAEDATS